MFFFKPKPSPLEDMFLCDGNLIARLEVNAHGYELRGWFIENHEKLLSYKSMKLEHDWPVSTNEESLLGRSLEWLDSNRYKSESRGESRMAMLYIFRKGKAYRVKFSRSSRVHDDNPVNQFIDQIDRYLPILI